MNSNHPLAHAEDGSVVESTGFDYDAVDRNVFGHEPDEDESDLSTLTPEQIEIGLKVFRALLQWIWQSGMKNPDGVKIRAIIACWIFLKELRPHSETDMAVGYGLKKQSLGRWVDGDPNSFKKTFPHIRLPHMR